MRRLFPVLFLVIATALVGLYHPTYVQAQSAPVRGTTGDLWADILIGKRSFAEIGLGEVVANKVFRSGGVIVDRSVSPGRAFVWDSGNNRILGINLSTCYAGSGACTASLVIGQPSGSDYGACNLDSSFATNPTRALASASSLCGIPETTRTVLEDKTFSAMAVTSTGDLYVPDVMNHRILKYTTPFTTNVVADDVWGQDSMSANGCNKTGGVGAGWDTAPAPSASSLCFSTVNAYGAGVTFDATGNMWVADGGNNRVLRFPKSGATIAKTADIVLGQANFVTGGDFSQGTAVNRLYGPSALQFDPSGNLLVADTLNNRVLKYSAPFTSGMSATVLISGLNVPRSLEIDPQGRGFWVADVQGYNGRVRLYDFAGSVIQSQFTTDDSVGGSLGFDTSGNILLANYANHDVYVFSPGAGTTYAESRRLFSPPIGPNSVSNRRLQAPAWSGIGLSGDQLVVSDGRLLFWNSASTVTTGEAADGYIEAASFSQIPDPAFGQVKVDPQNRIWVTKKNEIWVYTGPLTSGEQPIKKITGTLSLVGGGSISWNEVYGLAPTADGKFLWVSDTRNHRVLRIQNPLSATPLVDVIIGQTTSSAVQCNRGAYAKGFANPSLVIPLSYLCSPGALSLDHENNLYISDHFIETEGNGRLLLFNSALFPNAPSSVLYNVSATKSFPVAYNGSYPHASFEVAFNSADTMVMGNNPYMGSRYVSYYLDPTKVNTANRADPSFAVPDGELKDFSGWPVAMTFDSQDNLYTYDANRGQVRYYKQPLTTITQKVDLKVNGSDGIVVASSGQTLNLTWDSVGSTNCEVPGSAPVSYPTWTGTLGRTGSMSMTAASVGNTFEIVCRGTWGVMRDQVSVVIDTNLTDTVVSLTGNAIQGPLTVPTGTVLSLNWMTQAAQGATVLSCVASGNWTGTKTVSGGTQQVTLTTKGNYSYILTCTHTLPNDSTLVTTNDRVDVTVVDATSVKPGNMSLGERGWLERFYSGINFDTLQKTQILAGAPVIYYDWGSTGSPDMALLGVDNYSARWTGQFVPWKTGTYTFTVTKDDAARVKVGSTYVINSWVASNGSTVTGTISLVAGKVYPLTAEYYEKLNNARMLMQVTFAGETGPASTYVISADNGL